MTQRQEQFVGGTLSGNGNLVGVYTNHLLLALDAPKIAMAAAQGVDPLGLVVGNRSVLGFLVELTVWGWER